MLEPNKAPTIRELIAELQSWNDQDQKVAYVIFNRDDLEGDADYYKFPSVPEAWDIIADEFQENINEGYAMNTLQEELRSVTEQHFEYIEPPALWATIPPKKEEQ